MRKLLFVFSLTLKLSLIRYHQINCFSTAIFSSSKTEACQVESSILLRPDQASVLNFHDMIPVVFFTDTFDSGKEKLLSLKRCNYFWYWNAQYNLLSDIFQLVYLVKSESNYQKISKWKGTKNTRENLIIIPTHVRILTLNMLSKNTIYNEYL